MTDPRNLRAAIGRALSRPPVTRFAPSPTGYLHLGHVVNALYVWGLARATGGRVHFRLEDHDRRRCRPDYEAALLEDLAWLGFEPDSGRTPLDRQSDRAADYARALDGLTARGLVYACACSRREIGAERYDGRCRDRGLSPGPGRGLRVRLDDTTETVVDLMAGVSMQRPAAQCGDLLARDRDGQWTYQFAVTVDDAAEGITLVVRGADLLDSAGRQIALARLLGRAHPPAFLHHPLIYAPGGEKLSKAAGDVGIRELRLQGIQPDEVVGRAAAAVGLLEPGQTLAVSQVPALFHR